MSRPTALAAFCLACSVTAAAAAQSSARLHGTVSDDSGGVLPGVTVTVDSRDGRALAVETTDAVGAYAMEIPPGTVRVTFSLEGFTSATVDLDARGGGDIAAPTTRLALAPRSETVVVRGDMAPAASRRDAASVPPPVLPVLPHDRDSICGPAKPNTILESLGRVQAPRNSTGVELYSAGELLSIDGGTATGLSVGQNVVARRVYRVSGDPDGATGEHTAGLLQIVGATDKNAIGVVIYACDEIRRGDRLAAFEPEPMRTPEPFGVPAYDNAARVLFADSGQLVGAPHRLLVIGRGRDDDVRPGQRITLFRRGRGLDPVVIGDAVVVAARHDSATIRVEHAVDVIEPNDWAAPQRFADARR